MDTKPTKQRKQSTDGSSTNKEQDNGELNTQTIHYGEPAGEYTDTGSRENGETTLTPPQRKRGRPFGSKNRSKTNTTQTINLQEETIDSSGKELPTYKSKKKTKFLSEDEAQQTANFILETTNALAVGLLGNEAALNLVETSLLSISLPKYLATLEIDSIERGSKLMYPLLGIVGVSLYGMRLTGIVMEKRKQAKENSSNKIPFTENNTSYNNNVKPINGYEEESNDSSVNEHTNGGIEWSKGRIAVENRIHGF